MEPTPRPWHELEEALPPLSRWEMAQLRRSIEESGVINPVLVLPDGRIIDGHHRWRAAGDTVPVSVLDLDEDIAWNLGLALNVARRQLSNEQIEEAIKHRREAAMAMRAEGATQEETAIAIGVHRRTVDDWESKALSKDDNISSPPDNRVSIPKAEHKNIYERRQSGEKVKDIAADYKATPTRISQIAKQEEMRRKPVPEASPSPMILGNKYQCIVIDPPWPMKKLEREERPAQGPNLDYPTMTLEEIEAIQLKEMTDPNGCHIYLWTTHKFLPDALRIFERWGVRYECLLTWVKPSGFTPFSWMYNTEHVLFGRVGKSLEVQKKGMKLAFNGSVGRQHSKKPEEFYSRVVMASPEPRLEMFARQPHDGFDAWGDEVGQ